MIQRRAALEDGITTFDTADFYAGSKEQGGSCRASAIGYWLSVGNKTRLVRILAN